MNATQRLEYLENKVDKIYDHYRLDHYRLDESITHPHNFISTHRDAPVILQGDRSLKISYQLGCGGNQSIMTGGCFGFQFQDGDIYSVVNGVSEIIYTSTDSVILECQYESIYRRISWMVDGELIHFCCVRGLKFDNRMWSFEGDFEQLEINFWNRHK